MNSALLTAVLALGANPDADVTLVQTVSPQPTPVAVRGTPYIAARALQPATPGTGDATLAAVLALGNAPDATLQLPLQRVSVVPVQPGIVGPVHLRVEDRLPADGRIGAPALTDLRGGA